jgi:hypothetical protein
MRKFVLLASFAAMSLATATADADTMMTMTKDTAVAYSAKRQC